MFFLKTILISTLIWLHGWNNHQFINEQKCESLTVEYTVKSVEAQSGSRVSMDVTGGTVPYKYLFYKQSGHLLSEGDFDSNNIIITDKGKYYCTILDKKGCYKTVEFEIK